MRRSSIWANSRFKPPYGSVEIEPASGATSAVLFNEGAGAPFELASGKRPSVSGSYSWITTAGGLATSSFRATNGYLNFGSDAFRVGTKGLSIFAVVRPDLSGGDEWFMGVGGSVNSGVDFLLSGGAPNTWKVRYTGVTFITSTIVPVTNHLLSIGIVVMPGTGVRFSEFDYTADRWRIETIADASSPASNNLAYLGSLAGGSGWQGSLLSTYTFPFALSDGQLSELHAFPWSVIRPIVRRRSVRPASAAATTTSKNIGNFLTLGVGT